MEIGTTSRILGMLLFILWSTFPVFMGAEVWQAAIAGSIAGIFGVLWGAD